MTAPLKHYAIGLRRVGKCVSLPSRRKHPATLAAAMLLAFFECWSADHQKWTNHLLGARQLVKEIDFEGMARHAKRLKEKRLKEDHARFYQALQLGMSRPQDDPALAQVPLDVDENIVEIITGRNIPYDQYSSDASWNREYTEKDLDTFETQRDLFWWYCKQDAYQSILGGGELL